ANARTESTSTRRKACSEPAWRIVVPRAHSATWQVMLFSCDSICSNWTIRLARRGCSPPSGRRVIAKTRLISGASSRISSASLPTKPLAPASNATLCSPSAMARSSTDVCLLQHKSAAAPRQAERVTILHKMRALLLSVVLVAPVVQAGTDAERVQVYREFRAVFDAKQYKEALPLAAKLVAMTEEQYGAADRALVNPLSNLATTEHRLHDFKTSEET